jgi:hypothetical protein
MRHPYALLCLGLLGVLGCEQTKIKKRGSATPTGSGQVLDGMQLESARRIARQSAEESMSNGDAQRLKQLRTWVEGRASVPVFPPEDLAALDVAIACLEKTASPTAIAEGLEQAETSELAASARRACEP